MGDVWNDYTPVYFILNGKEYFFRCIVNGNSNNEDKVEFEAYKRQLIKNDYMFLRFYGGRDLNPIDFAKYVIRSDYKWEDMKFKFDESHNRYMFHGNLKQYSGAFSYYIYDEVMANELKLILNGNVKVMGD